MAAWIESLRALQLTLFVFVVLVCMTLLGLVMGYAGERFWWARGRKVFEVALKRGQLRTEMLGTVLFHFVFAPPLIMALHTGLIHFSSGWLAELLGFFVPWYGFMIFYYFMHRSMHHKRLFWMHKWHHESLVTTPMTGFSMHPAEAIGWTIGMLTPCILLAQAGLLGFWGWAVWLGITWSGNIAGHANAEMFPLRSSRATTLFMSNPISYHSLHHARFDGHYGFVAAMMDRLFGTEFSDWKELHDRIFDGQSLRSLRERGAKHEPRDGQSSSSANSEAEGT